MLDGVLLGNDHLRLMKQALTAYSLRHRVVADNLANLATEGFRAREVSFEETLARTTGRQLPGLVTNPAHLPLGQGRATPPQAEPVGEAFDNGVNDVNVDREMGELVKNELAFRLATRLLGRRYDGMRMAITGRTR